MERKEDFSLAKRNARAQNIFKRKKEEEILNRSQ